MLTINFAAVLARQKELSVSLTSDCVLMEADNEDLLLIGFNNALKEAAVLLRSKLITKNGTPPIRDFYVHKNDRKTLENLLGRSLDKTAQFAITIADILQSPPPLSYHDLNDLSLVEIKSKRTKLSIRLGNGQKLLAVPQIMLFERFESRYEFPRGRGGGPIEVRASIPWILVLLAGFAVGYAGAYEDEALIYYITEDILRRVCEDKYFRDFLLSQGGLIPLLTRLNVPPRPKIAYVIYTTCHVLNKMRQQSDFLRFLLETPLILEIDRIRGWKAFTLLERFSIDMHPLLRRLSELPDKVVTWLENKAKRTLFALVYGGTAAEYSHYINFITLAYEVLTGAEDPTALAYYAMRVLAEKEAEKRKDEEEKLRYLMQESYYVKEFLKSAQKWAMMQ
ncbi:MAG: hypothetical protein ACTSXX_05735 [Candidatus Baldrarchaeia archaeon]